METGPPSFSVVGGDAGSGPFVVAAVDPDAPTPQMPTSAQIRHFLGANFFARKPSSNAHPLVNTTAAISPYLHPARGQPSRFDTQTLVTPATSISLFNISSFAAATGLGAPIAGTFMLVAPDPPAA
ncbi:hypothetical protein D9615_002004 [Tricholomella constricta]|uniref:Uncharacterized protein n=1 Tax=Tricholomella constricta TaxID=117010 RepID=A0A8H5HP70_9AGAR|nr:hypothetical protein D9615_002004 [Tricholomella constricta]